MAEIKLTPTSFAGNSLNDANYTSYFSADGIEPYSVPDAQAVETMRPENYPVHVTFQPGGRVIALHVRLRVISTSNLEALRQWFDPTGGEQLLIATDEASVQRQIRCLPLGGAPAVKGKFDLWVFRLRAASPLWEAVTATTPSDSSITSSGQTFTLQNTGNAKSYPTFTLTPVQAMADSNSWTKRRRITLANRSERPLADPVGDGYPIELGNNGFAASTLQAAGKLLSTMHDLRVLLAGAEINRWLDPSTATDPTRIWANLQLPARKTVTIKTSMTSGSPADGASLEVSNAEGTSGWPDSGFLVIADECIQYTGRTLTAFTGLTRGARNTTAASHTAGDTAYWVALPWIDLIYDYSNASDPAPPTDRKPIFSLADSRNATRVYPGPFFNDSDRRSGAFQPEYTQDSDVSGGIRMFEESGTLVFENQAPAVGKRRFNNAVLDCPIPIDDASGAVELDFTVEEDMLLHGYLIDRAGYESRLITEGPQGAQTNQTYTPASEAYRLRLNARIGVVAGNRVDFGSQVITFGDGSNPGPLGEGTHVHFELDDFTEINAVALYLERDSGATSDVHLMFFQYPDILTWDTNFTRPGGRIIEYSSIIVGSTIPTTFDWLLVPLPTPLRLPPGEYTVGVLKATSTGTIRWKRADGRVAARTWRINSPTASGPGFDSLDDVQLFLIMSETTAAQVDSPQESENRLTLDNIELDLDADRAPKIVLAPEETLYLMNARLKNDTTGDYLDILHPMKLGESLVIDCQNRTIRDMETGRYVPFAITPSNPDEWLYTKPRSTDTYSYTETGVVEVTIAKSYRNRWL